MDHVLSVIATAVAVIGLLAGLVAWLLKIRAEITAIAASVEALKKQVTDDARTMHERCAERKQWMLDLTETIRVVDKNQTRLAAMLGVDVQDT